MKHLLLIILTINSLLVFSNPPITPNQFKKGSDSDRIEAAIREALKTGDNSIEIPRYNQQRQKAEWLIDRAIVLPSDFTLVLRDCLVRLSPGTQDNIITNSGARTEPLSKNQNIRITGIGNAVLSGGLEAHWEKPGHYNGFKTIGILLYNTQHFTIENVEMEETHCWAISIEHSAFGRISNIRLNNTNKYPNQDGVDIWKGCHDILIENVTGVAGDDVVAIGALRYDPSKPLAAGMYKLPPMWVGGALPTDSDDVYNIIVNNVQAKCAGGHGIIRLLNQDGIKMYNVFINNVMDTSSDSDRRVQAAIRIGDSNYASISHNKIGDTYRIFINNVVSRGRYVVFISRSLKDSVIKGVTGYGDSNEQVVKINGEIENVDIEAHKIK